jgi:hypothetical protein
MKAKAISSCMGKKNIAATTESEKKVYTKTEKIKR